MRKLIDKYRGLPLPAKASFWFLICSFLQRGISVITTPIFTRLFTTADYGQYNVFNSWLGIISIFVSLNLSMGVYTTGLVRYDKERKVLSSSLQGLTVVLVSAWTVVYLLFHNLINGVLDLTTVQMLALLLMCWTTATFNFWASEQRVYYRYRALVAITLVVSIAKPVLGIILVTHSQDKVTARILGLAICELMGYSWCFFYQMRRGKKFYDGKFWKYALAYNLPLIPHYLSQTVLNNSDRIMISSMVGKSEAGIYSLAYSLAMIMTLFNNALSQTLNPWMYQKIKEKKISEIAPIGYLSLGIVAIVNLLLIMLAPEAVRIFAPSSYYEAIYCIPPVAMGVYFLFSYDLFGKFAFYYGKTTWIMFASIGGAALNILLNYYGIRMFGYVAAAYTTLICYIVFVVFHYLLMRLICNKYLDGVRPYNTGFYIAFSLMFLACGFAMLFTYDHPVIRYGIIFAMIVIVIWQRKRIKAAIHKIIDLREKKL